MSLESSKCHTCEYQSETGYDFCNKCIKKYIRICTCNKKFIKEKPTQYIVGNIEHVYTLPQEIPDFFYTKLKGNIYHIFACRGCQCKGEISVRDNFDEAVQASILSCVYQKVEENDKSFYEYMSDSIDPEFEKYVESFGIKLGEPANVSPE